MLKFEDFIKAIDKDIRVEIYNKIGDPMYNGKLRNLTYFPEFVMRISPQHTSREVYLEIYTY